MTSAERRHCMRLLQKAQHGDEDERPRACEELAGLIARLFRYMIRGYSSVDPAYDRDDLLVQFQLGIWQAISRVDGRGDPLYHLAWRGQRAVGSLLQTIKQRRQGTEADIREFGQEVSVGTLPVGWDLADSRPEADPTHVVDRLGARTEVRRMLERTELSERQQEVVAWMLVDPDPTENGANLRLASALGISPQAASNHRRATIKQLGGREPAVAVVRCDCGQEFRSKGALTQHKRGQSGHRPCLVEAHS